MVVENQAILTNHFQNKNENIDSNVPYEDKNRILSIEVETNKNDMQIYYRQQKHN